MPELMAKKDAHQHGERNKENDGSSEMNPPRVRRVFRKRPVSSGTTRPVSSGTTRPVSAGVQLGISGSTLRPSKNNNDPEDLMRVLEESFQRRQKAAELQPDVELDPNRISHAPPPTTSQRLSKQMSSLRAIYSQPTRRSNSGMAAWQGGIETSSSSIEKTTTSNVEDPPKRNEESPDEIARPATAGAPSRGSTIGELIKRFRSAPPAAREERGNAGPFWWQRPSTSTGVRGGGGSATAQRARQRRDAARALAASRADLSQSSGSTAKRPRRRLVRAKSSDQEHFTDMSANVEHETTKASLRRARGDERESRDTRGTVDSLTTIDVSASSGALALSVSTATEDVVEEDIQAPNGSRQPQHSSLLSDAVVKQAGRNDSRATSDSRPRSRGKAERESARESAPLSEAEDILDKWRKSQSTSHLLSTTTDREPLHGGNMEEELDAAVSRVRRRLGLDKTAASADIGASGGSFDFPSKLRQTVSLKTTANQSSVQSSVESEQDLSADDGVEETLASLRQRLVGSVPGTDSVLSSSDFSELAPKAEPVPCAPPIASDAVSETEPAREPNEDLSGSVDHVASVEEHEEADDVMNAVVRSCVATEDMESPETTSPSALAAVSPLSEEQGKEENNEAVAEEVMVQEGDDTNAGHVDQPEPVIAAEPAPVEEKSCVPEPVDVALANDEKFYTPTQSQELSFSPNKLPPSPPPTGAEMSPGTPTRPIVVASVMDAVDRILFDSAPVDSVVARALLMPSAARLEPTEDGPVVGEEDDEMCVLLKRKVKQIELDLSRLTKNKSNQEVN